MYRWGGRGCLGGGGGGGLPFPIRRIKCTNAVYGMPSGRIQCTTSRTVLG